jgi:hypothetical protein
VFLIVRGSPLKNTRIFWCILPIFLDLQGVEMAQMVADICSFAMVIPLARSELKKMKEQIYLSS